MALTVKGFTGSVGQADFGRLNGAGIVEGIVGTNPAASSLRADRVVGQNRRVTVQPGAAKAPGVRADLDLAMTYDFPANTAGSPRLDWLVLRFDWGTDPGTCVLVHVQGTAATNPARPTLTRNAGVRWEVPLALVRVDNNVADFPSDAVQDARFFCGHGDVVQQSRGVDPTPDRGRLLYIVSTDELLVANGSAFSVVGPTISSGSLSLAAGFDAFGGGAGAPSYVLQDGRVDLVGLIGRSGATLSMDENHPVTVINALPVAIRPPLQRNLAAGTSDGVFKLAVGPSGAVSIVPVTRPSTIAKDSGWISLDGLTYRV